MFLDELNACSQEVQKAFYSLINERRIGEYHLPEGSIVIGAGTKEVSEEILRVLAYGLISASHVGMFLAFTKQLGNKNLLREIIKGTAKFPPKPEERDVLYFVAQSFRALLLHELPEKKQKMNKEAQYLAHSRQ